MPNVAQSDKCVGIAKAGKTKILTVNSVKINLAGYDNLSSTTPIRGQIYPKSKMWKSSS